MKMQTKIANELNILPNGSWYALMISCIVHSDSRKHQDYAFHSANY